MATKKLGNDYMLWVESVTPGTYNLILGQGSSSITRSAAKIDTSSKDDLGYGTSAPGLRDLSVSLDIKPKLPDATGFTRLETLCNASPQVPFNIQIRKNGTTAVTGDAVFQCSVYGNLDDSSFGESAVVTSRASFYAAAAPTIDALT